MSGYWDTSALLALLFQEPATSRVRRLASQKGGLPGYTAFFTFIEMEAAYTRRLAESSLSQDDLTRLRLQAQRLENDLGIIWADKEVLLHAKHFAAEIGLRPGDALQLASAKVLAQKDSNLSFVCLDGKLNKAAEAVGLSPIWK